MGYTSLWEGTVELSASKRGGGDFGRGGRGDEHRRDDGVAAKIWVAVVWYPSVGIIVVQVARLSDNPTSLHPYGPGP